MNSGRSKCWLARGLSRYISRMIIRCNWIVCSVGGWLIVHTSALNNVRNTRHHIMAAALLTSSVDDVLKPRTTSAHLPRFILVRNVLVWLMIYCVLGVKQKSDVLVPRALVLSSSGEN